MKWLRGFWKSSSKSGTAPGRASGPFIRAQEIRVSVGLDFGTHATKAAFFQFGAGARVVRPLRFQHNLEHWPDYVLPGVGLVRNRTLVWGAEAAAELARRPWRDGLRRLKVLLASSSDSGFVDSDLEMDYRRHLDEEGVDQDLWRPEYVATASLALQIVAVRRRLQALYPGKRIDAQFTVPVPIDHVQDSGVLAVYRRVANGAEQLTDRDGTLRVRPDALIPAAAEAYSAAPENERPDGRVFTLPEAVAEVASYLTSLEAKSGIHGVIDIGAGTTDVCVFSLQHPERRVQECYWYSALAIPKASTFVQEAVADALQREHPGQGLTEVDILRECTRNEDAVERALEKIRHLANPAWAEGYCHLKKDSLWRGCPVFLSGGGALLPRVRRVFQRCWVTNWPPHEIRELPTPRDYRGDGVPFQRMTVAYGLAIPKPEHGQYVLPKDSPDDTPPKRYKRYEGMGGDQLYPTPDWR